MHGRASYLFAAVAFLGCWFHPLPIHAQTDSEEALRKKFLKARERMQPVSKPKTTPAPTPAPAKSVEPDIQKAEPPQEKAEPNTQQAVADVRRAEPPTKAAEPTPAPIPKQEPVPQPSPKKQEPGKFETIYETPPPAKSEEKPTPTPTPDRPSYQPPRDDERRTVVRDRNNLTVRKSGLLDEEGEVPPSEKTGGGLFGFGGGGPKYKYLTKSVRDAINNAKVKRNRWKYIIVHNSGTRQGNAAAYEHYHRRVRKMQNGLAYHFVIGNGRGAGNGQIEIGNRWIRQINGGHVASDYLNNIAIGICLTGDFNRDKPTPQQLEALEELIRFVRKRVGKVESRWSIVRGHRQINPRPTDCPGDRFPLNWLGREFN